MRLGFLATVITLAFGGSIRASDDASDFAVDKEQLRKLLDLPKASSKITPLSWTGTKPRSSAIVREEIALLERRLDRSLDDAERHAKLRDLYGELQAGKASIDANFKALELLRIRMRTEAHSGRTRSLLAEALLKSGQYSEALREAQQAVEVAPGEAKCWQILAELKMWESAATLAGGWSQLRDCTTNDIQKLAQELKTREPAAVDQALAHMCRLEGFQCLARAIALAPHDASLYKVRMDYRFQDFVLRQIFSEESDVLASFGLILRDVRELARLLPEDPGIQASLAVGLIAKLTKSVSAAGMPEPSHFNLSDFPESEDKQWLEKGLARLEELSGSNEKETARASLHFLSMFSLISAELPKAEKLARRAIDLEDKEESWDVLANITHERGVVEGALIIASAYLFDAFAFINAKLGDPTFEKKASVWASKAYVNAVRERFARFPNARNHYCLAQAYHWTFETELALRTMRSAAAKYPDDARCQLGLGVLLAARPNQPIALAEFEESMARAAEILKKSPDDELAKDFSFIVAICYGLNGETQRCFDALTDLRERNPDDERIREALTAFRLPPLPNATPLPPPQVVPPPPSSTPAPQ